MRTWHMGLQPGVAAPDAVASLLPSAASAVADGVAPAGLSPQKESAPAAQAAQSREQSEHLNCSPAMRLPTSHSNAACRTRAPGLLPAPRRSWWLPDRTLELVATRTRPRRRRALPAEGLEMSPAENLLSRLQRVRRTGPGRWIASSPTREDRHPSLAIRELDDGRVLVHDFGGDDVAVVVAAVGLDLADLFPKSPGANMKPVKRPFIASDVLALVAFESSVAVLVSFDVLEKRAVSEDRLWPPADRRAAAGRRRGGVRCSPLIWTSWRPLPIVCDRTGRRGGHGLAATHRYRRPSCRRRRRSTGRRCCRRCCATSCSTKLTGCLAAPTTWRPRCSLVSAR